MSTGVDEGLSLGRSSSESRIPWDEGLGSVSLPYDILPSFQWLLDFTNIGWVNGRVSETTRGTKGRRRPYDLTFTMADEKMY